MQKLIVMSVNRTKIFNKHLKILSRAHEEWGYCQAGTSAILLADKTALIGTPGPYTWRGTVFAVSTDDVSLLLIFTLHSDLDIYQKVCSHALK